MKMFRSRRRKLILTGKIKKYLVYALGEILLIVIGILGAWKINDLNARRQKKIVQEKIYASLYEELNTNLDVLDKAIVRYGNCATSLLNTLNYVGMQPDSINQKARKRIVAIEFQNSNLSNQALSSINATDKFQFIENDSLSELIAQYPTAFKSFVDQETKIGNIIENRLKPVLEKYISLVEVLPTWDEKFKNIRTFGQKSNFSGLMNCKEYQNTIIDELLQTQIQLELATELQSKTKELAKRLKQELDG